MPSPLHARGFRSNRICSQMALRPAVFTPACRAIRASAPRIDAKVGCRHRSVCCRRRLARRCRRSRRCCRRRVLFAWTSEHGARRVLAGNARTAQRREMLGTGSLARDLRLRDAVPRERIGVRVTTRRSRLVRITLLRLPSFAIRFETTHVRGHRTRIRPGNFPKNSPLRSDTEVDDESQDGQDETRFPPRRRRVGCGSQVGRNLHE